MATNAESFFQTFVKATDIENLIGKSEDLYFDAKTLSNESLKADSDQGALAKAISAFANADGGVIVYGLEAKRDAQSRDVVQAAKPISDPVLVQSRILGLVGQLLQPPVEGVRVEIRKKRSKKEYVVVFIPPSDSGPHRAKPQHEYYRRHGSASLPMEHYELEEMFGRRKRPKLELYWRVKHRKGSISMGFKAVIVIGLTNKGRGVAKSPCLVLKNCTIWEYGYDGNGNFGLPVLPGSNQQSHCFGATTDRLIYPGVPLEVTGILHPIEVGVSIGQETVKCSDLTVDYEIFAEDMSPVISSFHITARQTLKGYSR